MRTALPLRAALLANSTFSLFAALLMLTYTRAVASWLGVDAPLLLPLIGIGLLAFAFDLVHQATRERIATWRALYASTADLLWVFATVGLIAAFPDALSRKSNLLVLAVAGIVCAFAALQLWAITLAHRAPRPGLYRHCVVVEVNAPASAMWRAVSNLADIMHYMPSLRRSEIADGRSAGVGAVRTCEDRNGRRWSEECTDFRAGRSFDVRFLAQARDFPFPASHMEGGWEVSPSPFGARVLVWWEMAPKPRLLAPVILPLLAFQADRDFPKVIGRMAAHATGMAVATRARPPAPVVYRLLPSLC